MPLGIFTDKTDIKRADTSVEPVNLFAMAMPRDTVFKHDGTTRFADISVLKFKDNCGISIANRSLL